MPLPLIALFLAAFAVGTTELVVAELLPALSTDLAVDIPTAGLLISGYAVGVAVGGPVLAVLTNSLPRRPLLLALMSVFVLGNVLCALAASYWLLMGARLVIACSHGLFFGVALLLATRVVPRDRQGSAISLIVAGITFANVIGAPAGTAIGNAFGWHATFWVVAAIGVGATVALAVLIPSAPSEAHAKVPLADEIRVLGRPAVYLSYLMIALNMTAFFAVYAYIVPLLTTVTGIPLAIVPVLLFVAGVGGIFGKLIGGRLGDWRPGVALVVIFSLVAVLYLAWLAAVANPWAMGAAFFLMSVVGFSFPAPAQTLIIAGSADAPNLASTLISTAFNVGIAAGPWVGGMALARGWSYGELPWLSVVFTGLAILVAVVSLAGARRAAMS